MGIINDILSGLEKTLLHSAGSAVSGTGGKEPVTDVLPGDVKLHSIKLMSEDKQRAYDLLAQVTSIDLYESILSPVIYCELGIADSIGLQQSFPIIGEEYVSIAFETPSSKTPATYLFRVNQVMNGEIQENNKMVTYTLQCVSAELIRNASRFVTKPYEMTIDQVVKEIITDELVTEKPFHIETTVGIEKGMITRMQPFKAIDFLRRRAVSGQYKSSSWVFYEARDGYHFTTIEQLMSDGAKIQSTGRSDKEFFFDMARKDNLSSVTMRNILAYNQMSFVDTVTKIQQGGLYNEVSSFDILTGAVRKIKSDPQQQYEFADGKSGAPMNTSGFIRNHASSTARTKFVPISSDKPSTQRPEKISMQASFVQSITQNIVQIHIYGDTQLNLGDVIKCNFPSATTIDNDSGVSRLDSGNYMISKIRHIILNTDRPQHTIALELIKGNLSESA